MGHTSPRGLKGLQVRPGRPAAGLALLVALGVPAAAAPPGESPASLRFQQVSSERGLSDPLVFSLLEDRQGFLWVGTARGLNRYDGYGFLVFTPGEGDSHALADAEISALAEDALGRLWVGTRRGGLHLWVPDLAGFRRWPAPSTAPTELPTAGIEALLVEGRETLWIGTREAGLVRARLAPDGGVRFERGPAALVPRDPVRALHLDRAGRLWVGSDRAGLAVLDRAADRLQAVQLAMPGDPPVSPRITAVAADAAGRLWVGTHDHGVFRLDASGAPDLHLRSREGETNTLASDRIRSLWLDEDGAVWVATDRGLSLLDGEGGFQRLGYDPDDPNSLSDDSIRALYRDRSGVLWVGTENGGLNKLTERPALFQHLRENPADPASLASNRVTAIAEDREGALWVGTFDTGLNRRDPATGRFTSLRPSPGQPGSLPDLRVMSLAVDREDRLWVGTMAGGLSRLDRETGAFTTLRHDPADPRSLSYDGVTAILEGLAGELWVGTFRGGLNRLDPATGRFRRYPIAQGVEDAGGQLQRAPGGLSSAQIRTLFQESPAELWVGTGDAGLDLLDPETGRVVNFRHQPGATESLASDAIMSLHLDHRETLWIGTTAGLEAWARQDRHARRPRFRHYGEAEGLLGAPVWGILEDARGSLWLSTNHGLARFDPASGSFTNFGRSHGLPRDGFKFGAYLRAANGRLYFGSNAGVTAFDPQRVPRELRRPRVVVTRFFADNEARNLFTSPGELPRLRLDHSTNVAAFEFAVLDFLAPELNRFEYKLEGFDEEWTDLPDGRRATYTNLPPGEYMLRVRGANSEGIWGGSEPALGLVVEPPPWATWWAYTAYGLAAAGAILLYSRAQTRKLEREAEYSRRLEIEVQARTRALEEQNERLQYANRLLEIASVTDSLTGVHNRRFLLTSVERDIAQIDRLHTDANVRGEEERAVFFFLLCDLDGFKDINDRHGHSAGDLVLFQIRDLLSRACRSSDTLVRWGGDEFMIVGRSAAREHVEILAERIRGAVANHHFDIGGAHAVRLTCSIGYAPYPFVPTEPRLYGWEDVVELADRALFLAKRRGPDMWCGLFGTERTPETPLEDLLALVSERPELLADEGSIQMRSSAPATVQRFRTGT